MQESDAIRFLVRLACFAPLVAGLLLVNWVCTQRPVRRLFTHSLDDAAEALMEGKTLWSHIDFSDLKPIWVEHWRESPDVVVVGSSRVMQIQEAWFGPRRLRNLASFAGDFDEAVAMLQACLDAGKAPKLVLLELNPSLTFEGKSHVSPALGPHFRSALLHYGIFPPIYFSGPLTLDALHWDPQILSRRQVWEVSGKRDAGSYRMRPDGSADWDLTESGNSAGEVERSVERVIHTLDPQHLHWRTTSHPDWFDRRILLAFLDDLHARGIRVAVLLVPVHPAAYGFYSQRGGYDESWIRSDMARRGVPIVGSSSPTAAKATRDDFYDDVHPHADVLRRLLRESGIVE